MQIFRSTAEAIGAFKKTVITIGNFDGVHLAHQRVIGETRKRAQELSAASMAITFDPHPIQVLQPDRTPQFITPLPYKLELLAQTGLDAVLLLPFSAEFSQTSPMIFCRDYLQRLHALEIHEGKNFHFGHKATGTVEKLAEYGQELGFAVVVHPELRVRGDVVSSSRIRQLIREGRMGRTQRLLGRKFSVRGHIVHGRGLGHIHTVPTVNLAPYQDLLPANGVYVTRTRISERLFNSVTNIGVRPTFGADSFAVESHLLDYEPMPIEENAAMEITFLYRLREEKKWPNTEALKAQIGKDARRTKRYFALCQKSRKAELAK